MKFSCVDNIDDVAISIDSFLFNVLLLQDNANLTKDGPCSKLEAFEKFKIYYQHTHPLYVLNKDDVNYYLFY